ncbi:MAG TPA: PHP domain-containing protein [Candidatus Dormibacteraeota bacterium]|nr:PHP domain-containing protein [Candidatus Dormibacteraeota bacterium]HEX2682192.1 PHP domain-containing protein [Candidatus Dormibacteraeota bacterium]
MIADPHCHTTASDGMVSPEELVTAAVAANLNLIAITDHDTMRSVRAAQTFGENAGITVVAGEEITTAWPAQTHVMGWYLTKPIRRGMSLADTVDAIHEQGALAIIPHPFMPTYFGSIQPRMLRRLIEDHPVDGIELESTVPIGRWRRNQLNEFYMQYRQRLGAVVGGTDCHFGAHDIASVVTEYDGDFKIAVLNRTTTTRRLRNAGRPPASVALRQQWRSLVDLPIRRLRGQL